MRLRSPILFLLLPWSLSAAFADDEAIKEELDRHQGTWRANSSIYEGQEAPEAVVRSITRIVEKDHVVWKRDGKSFAGTKIELDPSRDPKTIDVIPDGGKDRGERVLGIYKTREGPPDDLHGRPGQTPAEGVRGREGERLHPPDVHAQDLGPSSR